jgi:hypothetical protein
MNMLVRAGRAFRAAQGKDPQIEGRDLAEWLRSGAEIGEAERELLAELVTGEWRQSKGRPNRPGPGSTRASEIVAFYTMRNDDLGPRLTKQALHETAKKFGESDRTIERYLEEARSRCEAVARAKANVAKK